MPKKIKKTEFIGKGCFLQGLGLLCPFIGLVAVMRNAGRNAVE